MYKLPKIAIITIFILLLGLNFIIPLVIWDFFKTGEVLTVTEDQYLWTSFWRVVVAYFTGIFFMCCTGPYTLLNFFNKLNNTIIINECILSLDRKKKELGDGIPDSIEVKIVPLNKK